VSRALKPEVGRALLLPNLINCRHFLGAHERPLVVQTCSLSALRITQTSAGCTCVCMPLVEFARPRVWPTQSSAHTRHP